MDDDQRKYFADMMSLMEGVASDARASASSSRETAAAVRKLDVEVRDVKGQVQVLNRAVFGSMPPPAPPIRPMSASIGEHDGDIAEVKGELLSVRAELEKQSKKMGIDAAGFWALVHNTKLQDVAKLGTFVGVLSAAIYAAFYAAIHGVK